MRPAATGRGRPARRRTRAARPRSAAPAARTSAPPASTRSAAGCTRSARAAISARPPRDRLAPRAVGDRHDQHAGQRRQRPQPRLAVAEHPRPDPRHACSTAAASTPSAGSARASCPGGEVHQQGGVGLVEPEPLVAEARRSAAPPRATVSATTARISAGVLGALRRAPRAAADPPLRRVEAGCNVESRKLIGVYAQPSRGGECQAVRPTAADLTEPQHAWLASRRSPVQTAFPEPMLDLQMPPERPVRGHGRARRVGARSSDSSRRCGGAVRCARGARVRGSSSAAAGALRAGGR